MFHLEFDCSNTSQKFGQKSAGGTRLGIKKNSVYKLLNYFRRLFFNVHQL